MRRSPYFFSVHQTSFGSEIPEKRAIQGPLTSEQVRLRRTGLGYKGGAVSPQ
jgi:hypothetical protein